MWTVSMIVLLLTMRWFICFKFHLKVSHISTKHNCLQQICVEIFRLQFIKKSNCVPSRSYHSVYRFLDYLFGDNHLRLDLKTLVFIALIERHQFNQALESSQSQSQSYSIWSKINRATNVVPFFFETQNNDKKISQAVTFSVILIGYTNKASLNSLMLCRVI